MNTIKVEVEEESVESDNSCFICLQPIHLNNAEQFNSLNFLLSYLKIGDKIRSVVCKECEENLARFAKLSKFLEKVRLEMDYLMSLFQSSILNSNNMTTDEFTPVRESLMRRCGKVLFNPKPELNLERVDISKLGKTRNVTHLTCYRETPKLQFILPTLELQTPIKKLPSNCSDDWSPNLDDEFDNDSMSTTSFATPVIKGIKMETNSEDPTPAVTEKRFACTKCPTTCSTKRHLQVHYDAVHLGLKPFKCSTCSKTFTINKSLRRHVDTVHLNLRPYKCDICGMLFGQKGDLKRHKESVHLGLEPFKCSKCPLVFSAKSNLRAHINAVHLQLKPYKCDKCDLAFAKSRSLRLHKTRLHTPNIVPVTNSNTFSCDICEKSYDNLQALIIHKRYIHSQELFRCDMCKKMFNGSIDLNMHILAVHKKQRYYCQVSGCDRSFSRGSPLLEHYALEHPDFSVPRQTPPKTNKRCLTKSPTARNLDNNLKVDEIFKEVRILNMD